MNAKKSLPVLTAIAAALFLTYSCSRDDSGSLSDSDLTFAQDEAFVDALYSEVDNAVTTNLTNLDANNYSPYATKSTSGDGEECAVITVDHPDSTHFPKVVTIDYGEGCTLIFKDDTITRKGKIIITMTNRWFVEGAQHIVTLENFSINDVKIEGTRTITNLGLNDENHPEMEILLEGGKVTFNDTAWMTREANHVKEWIRSYHPMNDTMLVTGTATGVNVNGETYERLITEPLVLVHCADYRWHWVIVDGTVQITNSVSGVTTIDYSSTGCDGTVIVSKNGFHHNYQFFFRKHNHRKGR
jgi:hypothetical protein